MVALHDRGVKAWISFRTIPIVARDVRQGEWRAEKSRWSRALSPACGGTNDLEETNRYS